MQNSFRVGVGQVVLLEWPDQRDVRAATGLVVSVDAFCVVADLTCEPPAALDGTRPHISVFAPDAMYRARASLHLHEGRVAELDDLDVGVPVQRRRWPRRRMSLPVSLVAVEDTEPAAVCGETVDICVGGARVITREQLHPGNDPLVAITMPDGDVMLRSAVVIRMSKEVDRFSYGVVFPEVEGDDSARWAELVSAFPMDA
jgi:hypothetical protein